jgi:hypothetical protein
MTDLPLHRITFYKREKGEPPWQKPFAEKVVKAVQVSKNSIAPAAPTARDTNTVAIAG